MTRLSGHHAVVTGAGTGIGAAIAKSLCAEGARLTLVGRRREKLTDVAAGAPGVLVAPADVTVRDEIDRAFEFARKVQGPITILVNNAGAAESSPFGRVTVEVWRQLMAVNLDALLHCCQAALPDLLQADAGRIVNIASTAALKGYAYTVPYVAAKHGALGFTRALAAELVKTRVTVNAVCPGFTETNMLSETLNKIVQKTGRSEPDARASLEAFNPQGRLIRCDEIASAVLWLCLAESRSVTGQAVAVAGGEVM